MPDTGTVYKDAVLSIAALLEANKTTLGVKKVYDYPVHETIGGEMNSISVEMQPESGGEYAQFSGSTAEFEFNVHVKITYTPKNFEMQQQYHAVLDMMYKIQELLIQNSQPDGFGELLSASEFNIDEVDTDLTDSKLLIGSIEVVLQVFKSIDRS